MKVEFKKSFLKDIETLGDESTRDGVRKVIAQVEQASALHEIQNVKKLRRDTQYYRIRIGEYRLGLLLQEDTVVFVRCLHRKDIYRYLP